MTVLVLGTVGKIAVMHSKQPTKRWCEAFAFAPPLFEGVTICVRDLGFAAAKATTLSDRIDSTASIIVIVLAATKLLPPAETPWKALIEESVFRVIPSAVKVPFDQIVLVLAFVWLDCPRFRRPTPRPLLTPVIVAPPPPLNVVAQAPNTTASAIGRQAPAPTTAKKLRDVIEYPSSAAVQRCCAGYPDSKHIRDRHHHRSPAATVQYPGTCA